MSYIDGRDFCPEYTTLTTVNGNDCLIEIAKLGGGILEVEA